MKRILFILSLFICSVSFGQNIAIQGDHSDDNSGGEFIWNVKSLPIQLYCMGCDYHGDNSYYDGNDFIPAIALEWWLAVCCDFSSKSQEYNKHLIYQDVDLNQKHDPTEYGHLFTVKFRKIIIREYFGIKEYSGRGNVKELTIKQIK